VAVWPIAARAQQPDDLRTIGFFGLGTPASESLWTSAFVQRMRELGWTEGRTVAIQYRWAEGRSDHYAEIASEFVRHKVDVIVTDGNQSTLVAKQATSVIPIVFAVAGDPLGTGLVASLGRPGGNVTGLSLQQTDAARKRLELLRDVLPNLHRLAVLANVGNPAALLEMGEVLAGARTLDVDIVTSEIRRAEDIAPALAALKGKAEALYVVGDPLAINNRTSISTLALAERLPSMYVTRDFVQEGGLMSYGPNFPDLFRRAADFVDKILRGSKPGDIPVEQPTKFDLVINMTTAKALGLTVPQTLLATADEVIE
jgi:putative tryptophan/tyrosine transport system substrate-binding protein